MPIIMPPIKQQIVYCAYRHCDPHFRRQCACAFGYDINHLYLAELDEEDFDEDTIYGDEYCLIENRTCVREFSKEMRYDPTK